MSGAADPGAGADAERRAVRPPGKRLFVGARISVATANALAGAAQTLARRARDAGVDVRWIPPVSYHVTLRFLGWTRVEAIDAVRDALEAAAAGISPVSFRTVRLGAFPSGDRASVVWAGVEAPAPLAELARRIEAACARLGYAPERRAFHPHVTIGRLREARAVREVVLPLAEQMFGDSALDSITLFESETKSSGSVYRELHKIRLESRSGAPISGPERQSPPVQLAASPALEPDTDDGWPRGQGATTEHDA
jgi:2'-5' RNA ligase